MHGAWGTRSLHQVMIKWLHVDMAVMVTADESPPHLPLLRLSRHTCRDRIF